MLLWCKLSRFVMMTDIQELNLTLSELFCELHCQNLRMYQVFVVAGYTFGTDILHLTNFTLTHMLGLFYNQFENRYAASQTVGSLLGSDVLHYEQSAICDNRAE